MSREPISDFRLPISDFRKPITGHRPTLYALDVELIASLNRIAEGHGAVLGVTDLAPFPEEAERIADRVSQELHGGLSFTYANPDRAATPTDSFPWASSIVVVAVGYLRDGDGRADGRTVARFADGDRYVHLTDVLGALADELEKSGHRTEIVFDDNRLIDRAVAVRAGVGWPGKSTMVLTPGFGPWILLGSVVTDATLPTSEPMTRTCGTCDACLPACPTDAIIAPGVLDARRCIAAILQRRGPIDPELRPAIEGRIYGCDDCLTACPPGDRYVDSVPATRKHLEATAVLTASDAELGSMLNHWYVPSRKMRFVRRNALVALGNTGGEDSLGILSGYVGHPDPLLAGHAAWAVGRIGGPVAHAICSAALRSETDPVVREELAAAVTASLHGGVYAESMNTSQHIDSKENAR